MKDFTKRYCVSIVTECYSPMYGDTRYNHDSYFFDTVADAEYFKQQQRQLGHMTTEVIDLKSLPF